jgi:ATP synthase F1 gamma subunit
MPSIKFIKEEQEFFESFNNFMLTYQQLGAIKMQQIRGSIIQTRRYMDGIADIFVDVQEAHKKFIKQIKSTNKNVVQVSFSTFKKNKFSAVVLISPDTKFSGAINKQVFAQFEKSLSQAESRVEVIIVGKVGEQLFKERFPQRSYIHFHIPQAQNKIADLKTLIEKLVNYNRVDVFYPRFFSLIKQNPVMTNITGNISLGKSNVDRSEEERNFVFEPKLDTMIRFFELQVFTSLLQQTVNESYLANLGSRIVTLESATQSVKNEYQNLTYQYRNTSKQLKNKHQRSQIAGISLW